MAWPSPQEYSEAVQNPKSAFSEPDLRDGYAELDRSGLPRPRSGSFATVYKILSQRRNWAVKCFVAPVSDQQERYARISAHLAKVNLSYLVQFSFLPRGIKVNNQIYPILKMEWVEGESLAVYVEKNITNRAVLLALARRWIDMVLSLRRASLAHGDLQHGNILVVNGELRLVDYDGMYVPELAGKNSRELGQRNYQHPQRSEFLYGPNLDNFSSWVIYISLIAFAVQPQLWHQFHGGDDCLLFRREDYQNPNASAVFRTLENSRDDKLRSAVEMFRSMLELSPQDTPSLDGQLVPETSTTSTTVSKPAWLEDHIQTRPSVVAPFAPDTVEPAPSWIQDFLAPDTSEVGRRLFSGSIRFERIMCALSAVAIIALNVFILWGVRGLVVLNWADPILILANSLLLLRGFRLEPSAVELRGLKQDLGTAQSKTHAARAELATIQAESKALWQRASLESTNLEKILNGARADESRELDGADSSLQLQMNSIGSRRQAINQLEAAGLQDASGRMRTRLGAVKQKLADLSQAETSEISAILSSKQNQFVTTFLRERYIDQASIPGIGPGFKSRLRLMGVLTAADIDNRVYRVKGVGMARASSLFAWQSSLKATALAKMPKALTPAETSAIASKYAGQHQALVSEQNVLEPQIANAETSIRVKYNVLREPLDAEATAVRLSAQTKAEAIKKKYSERYKSVDGIRKKLKEDFEQSKSTIDEKIRTARGHLFGLQWNQEKVRRRLRGYENIRFSRYLRFVIGLGQ